MQGKPITGLALSWRVAVYTLKLFHKPNFATHVQVCSVISVVG